MFSVNQLRLLAILMSRPDQEFHLSGLGRLVGKSPGVFQRGINALERQGYILSRRVGNQRLFRVNEAHPLYPETKRIVEKTEGAVALLRRAVAGIKPIRVALIYGSYAADRMRADSDIDLLVVAGPEAEDALAAELEKIEGLLHREVNYRLYSPEEFGRKVKAGQPFIQAVLAGKHLLLKWTL